MTVTPFATECRGPLCSQNAFHTPCLNATRFRGICHRNLFGIGSIYYQLTQTHDFAGGNQSFKNIPANIICIHFDQTPTPKKTHKFYFNFNGRPSHWSSGVVAVFSSQKKLLRFPPTSARAHSPGCGIWKAGFKRQAEGCLEKIWWRTSSWYLYIYIYTVVSKNRGTVPPKRMDL